MVVSIVPFTGKSKQGKEYNCFKFTFGDYESLIFPRGAMERSYLEKNVGSGLSFEV